MWAAGVLQLAMVKPMKIDGRTCDHIQEEYRKKMSYGTIWGVPVKDLECVVEDFDRVASDHSWVKGPGDKWCVYGKNVMSVVACKLALWWTYGDR